MGKRHTVVLPARRQGKALATKLLVEELERRGYKVTKIAEGAWGVSDPAPAHPAENESGGALGTCRGLTGDEPHTLRQCNNQGTWHPLPAPASPSKTEPEATLQVTACNICLLQKGWSEAHCFRAPWCRAPGSAPGGEGER